jgi:hypothetical protein
MDKLSEIDLQMILKLIFSFESMMEEAEANMAIYGGPNWSDQFKACFEAKNVVESWLPKYD